MLIVINASSKPESTLFFRSRLEYIAEIVYFYQIFTIFSQFIQLVYTLLYIFYFFPTAKQVMNSEDCQIPVKRKRQQTGEWWLCRPEKTEETKVTDKQPTPKKSKQHSKKPSEEVPSPVKTKKDRVLKRTSQTKCAPSSSQKTNKGSERKNKQNKSRRGTPGKTKASEEIFDVIVEEQIDEQEQLEDLDPVDSSPLVLVHRDHSLDSGKVEEVLSLYLKEKQ